MKLDEANGRSRSSLVRAGPPQKDGVPLGAAEGWAGSKAPRPAQLWLASVLLVLPAAWPYVVHFMHAGDRIPMGFIHGDMASYMAHAREYFDGGGLTYGNPSSPFYDTAPIYFQPWTLLLGILWRVTGLDPGVIFLAFGAVATVVGVRVAISVYESVVALRDTASWMGLITFVWGGGILVLTGFLYNLITGDASQSVLHLDSGGGWWFLSFGRNFVYPTEAFFHLLFFGAILATWRKQFTLVLVLALLVSLSHPFTGAQLLLILGSWCFTEWYFIRSGEVPGPVLLGCGTLLALHLGYYLLFLSQFPEHRSLMEHWTQPWTYGIRNFGPAYLLVGGLTAWRMRRIGLARSVLASPGNRLLLVWFAVSFALANHEFALRPIQPLHFTRGYVWIPLFLLGAPTLVGLFRGLWSSRRRVLGLLGAAALMALFLADNAVWFASMRGPVGMYMTEDQRELVRWLDQEEHRGRVVLAEEGYVGYLSVVYTHLRAWHSHHFNTPYSHEREAEAVAFFRDGVFLDTWRTMPLLVVYKNGGPDSLGLGVLADLEAMGRFHNRTYTVIGIPGRVDVAAPD